MTRQEAIDKIIATTQYSIGAATLFVDNLEALGLIKFDEDDSWKMEFLTLVRKHNGGGYNHLIVELQKAGYKIVKEQS